MDRTPEIFEKIEGYLNNTLPKEELVAFEKEISNTPALKQEIEKHKSLHATLSDQDTLEFKEKLVKISTEIKKEETSSSFFSPFWKIAASIVVIFSVGTLFWYTINNQDQTKELYAQYYEPFPVEDVSRGEDDNALQDVMKSYSNGDYSIVISKLEELPNTIKKDLIHLYLGNSYLNTNQEEKAIGQFESIQKNSQYYENARWYLALTYLKWGNPKKIKPILQEIIEYNGVYKENATQLMNALTK